MQIEVNGIQIEVHKKEIKNMHLYVKPPVGAVSISAPNTVSDKAIEIFARTKIGWIKRQIERFRLQPRQTLREYVSGETLYLWGKQYFLYVEHGHGRPKMTLSGDRAILTIEEDCPIIKRAKFVNEWYRSLLKTEIERVLPKIERLTGLYCNEWRVKNMMTRWGTCNARARRIWLSLQLVKRSPDYLEYVILHELAHLKERSHGPKFTAILDKYMPFWKEIRKRMNCQPLDYMPPRSE